MTYPTKYAYEHACAALQMHRDRADRAEAEIEALRFHLNAVRLVLGLSGHEAAPISSFVAEIKAEHDLLRETLARYAPAKGVSSDNADLAAGAVWPAGCYDPDSCAYHRECMYTKCRHEGRDIFTQKTADIVPAIGDPLGCGFFAGRIRIDEQNYALIVAPKAEGAHGGLPWKSTWTATKGAVSLNDGRANTLAMNGDKHPAAAWCRKLRLGGFTDWYLPSRDEIELLYRNLKPTDNPNHTYPSRLNQWSVNPGNGDNRHSLPPGEAYTRGSPEQTEVPAFRNGGTEAFDRAWYWSSTEFSKYSAWAQYFDDGDQDYYGKDYDLRVRAVRKILI